jgi:predicted metal-dependent peptidase
MNATIPAHKLKIVKAKQKAAEWMPYLQSVFGPMRCIATAKCPRAAVDKYGKMYYNPEFVMGLSIETLAYIVLHETLHLVLSHHKRTEKMIPEGEMTSQKAYVSNVAQDLSIYQILAEEIDKCYEPQNIVTLPALSHIPGIVRNRTSENYYEVLLKYYEDQKDKSPTPPPPPTDPEDGDEDEDESLVEDESYGEDTDDSDFGDGDESETEDDDTPGSYGGSPQDEEDDEDGGDSQPETGSGDVEPQSKDRQPKEDGKGDGSQSDPSDYFPDFGDVCNPGDAGSNSDGIEKEWEEEPTLADLATAEKRLREAEEALEELDPCVGSGAGNIRQSLKARLHPFPDPFDQLKTVVARTVASPVGSPELTYRKWPRRQLPGKCRLRGTEKYTPEATILLDTSGSMLSSDVQQKALAIVAKGISRLQNPRIVCCDGAIQSAKRVCNMNQFQWDGGGGTDMAAGLIYVDKTYKPDSIVIITDGFTAWPSVPLRAKVVCALCRPEWANKVPKWITTVHLYRKGEGYAS